jgi:hypothetical protein
MRFHQTIANKGKRLNRLAALLFALAGLAERAAGSASPVCLLVLWLIRPTEALARDLVENIAPGAACPPEPVWPRDGATEALRLAQSLRLLADILAALAEHCLGALPSATSNHQPAGFLATPAMRCLGRCGRAARQFPARGPPKHVARMRPLKRRKGAHAPSGTLCRFRFAPTGAIRYTYHLS